MFCRKCGKTLLDGDRFCSYCGAQVIERNENIDIVSNFEEVVYNSDVKPRQQTEPSIQRTDLKGDEFNVPKLNITQKWQELQGQNENEDVLDKQGMKNEPQWNLDGFPLHGEETRRTEEISVDWGKRKLLRFEDEEEETTKDESKNQKTEIFEVFDKLKNQESPMQKRETLVFKREPIETNALEKEIFADMAAKKKTNNFAEEQIDKFYTFSQKNEEFQKLLDQEYERIKKTPLPAAVELKTPSNIENLEIKVPKDVLEPTVKREKKEVEVESVTSPKEQDNRIEIDEEAEEAIKETKQEERNENVEVNKSTPEIERDKLNTSDNKITIEALTKEAVLEKDINLEEVKPSEIEEEIEKSLEQENEVLEKARFLDEMETSVEAFTDDEKAKKVSPMAIALGVIIVVLVFEVLVLGIKCFFPESGAAAFINDKLGVTVNWIDKLKEEPDKNKNQGMTDESGETQVGEGEEALEASTTPELDKKPNADKNYLVTEALAYNKNIKSITADDTLVYKESQTYADKNINNSKTIENNIWYEDENGNAVYYDKEIVKTIIQFNSAWIDFVNNRDDSVLGFTKEGSPAYKSSKSFSKVGKITESFDVLKIGEIRQSEKGFYIWVYEEISITENKSTKVSTHKWTYYLEPVDKQFKIVSFTEF